MPNNPIHVGIAENLGASSQVIPLGELFSALETGVVDGQDNGMVTVIAQNLQEVQKYLYETNHIIATLEIIVNSDKLDEMSENQRQIIRDAAKAAAEQSWNDYIASVDSDRQTLIDAGVTVTQLTPEDQAKIIEKIQPTIDKLLAENDWAAELTEKIKAVQ
jgi:TRAP-type C4-dicarboxylate transport system substrate-binding protein